MLSLQTESRHRGSDGTRTVVDIALSLIIPTLLSMPKRSRIPANPTQDIVFLLLWCSILKPDLIELVVVATIKVIPHSFIRLKASMIFACLGPAMEAIPNVSVTVRGP
ncbi:hypothetical protein BDZ45DRAFT_673483 [Acephala macrosclerotiorum]|nr:hypothetical protein BDZ45DRAFT_673483 [Acephala macrosclerotiorum]